MTQFHSGRRKRPAFDVRGVVKAIVHGTLDDVDNEPATMLVYDFYFLSHRSGRIKDATISFEFQAKEGGDNSSITVRDVAPCGKHVMMQTKEKVVRTSSADGGISGGVALSANLNMHTEKTVERETTYAAEVIGDTPCDDWGNFCLAQWSLEENKAQRSGIVSLFRACILLTRVTDDEFELLPTVEVTPDLKTRLASLLGFRRRDDPVRFAPKSEPIDELGGNIAHHRWNLGAVDLNKLWDCTFYRAFGEAVKASKPHSEPGGDAEIVTTIVETKESALV